MYNIISDAGVIVARNVSKEEALEWLVKGLNSDGLHFTYRIQRI